MKIIFTAQDPGGCDSLIPIIRGLSVDNGADILCMMSKKSKSILEKEHIEFIDVDKLDQDDIFRMISDFAPDIVVSGTSFGLSIDKVIIEFAKENNLKTLSIVDYWSNYWPRFKTLETNKIYLPDVICVIDEFMKHEMINEGFKESLIKVTGNPRFAMYKDLVKDENIINNQILFISQPLSKHKKEIEEIGYDEFIVLQDVIETLIQINKTLDDKYQLLIKLHPKENLEKYDYLLKEYKDMIIFIVDYESDISELISSAGLIIGMSSIVLLNAALLNKQIISYQPRVKNDLFILNKIGEIKTIKNKEGLKNKIINIIEGKEIETLDNDFINKYCNKNSIINVIDIIKKTISKP